MSQDPLILPIVTIDPTFATVVKDVQSGDLPTGKFWVSCYKSTHDSQHAKIAIQLHEQDRDWVVYRTEEAGVKFESDDNHTEYFVSSGALGVPATRVLPPIQQYFDSERSNPRRPQRITAFALSPDTSKFATGFLDGSVFIYPVSSLPPAAPSRIPVVPEDITYPNTALITSRAHKSTITTLRFFPSNRVVLTASADFSLTIIPADLPSSSSASNTTTTAASSPQIQRVSPARTFKGHTRSIASTCTVGVGRAVLSASLDGTVRIWDVPSATGVATLPAWSAVLCMTLVEGEGREEGGGEGDTDLAGKLLFCGLQNGAFEVFELGIKRSVYRSPPSSGGGISTIAYYPSRKLLATGSSRGVVTIWDVGSLVAAAAEKKVEVVKSWKRNDAGVESLAFFPASGSSSASNSEVELAVGGADGLPYIVGVDLKPEAAGATVTVKAELAGGDCDPTRGIAVAVVDDGRKEVWTAGDDAVVRRYAVP